MAEIGRPALRQDADKEKLLGKDPLEDMRHEHFAILVASGELPKFAYKHTLEQLEGKQPSDASCVAGGKRWYDLVNVRKRIMYLKNIENNIFSWSRELSTKRLREIVDSPEAKDQDRIRAIEALNRMHGVETPKNNGVNINNNGLMFFTKDGITLSDDFLKNATKKLEDSYRKELEGGKKDVIDVEVIKE